jgi:hypothetical protein
MPSRNRGRPSAPTRLVDKPYTGDRFNALVYHVNEADIFLIIDYHARPEPYDWVVVARPSSEKITIALYDGQPYIGVARMLEFHELTQSEQWTPRIKLFDWPH